MKKIILVGNDDASSPYDYSEFIDSCDIVVRFNFVCSFRTGLAGSKTSVLVLWIIGDKGSQILNRRHHDFVIKNTEEIWFIPAFSNLIYPFIEKHKLQNRIIKELHINVVNRQLPDTTILDAYPLIEKHKLQNKIITELHISVFDEQLNLYPTSGMIIINYVLKEYKDYEKYIVFFRLSQLLKQQHLYPRHNFARERDIIQEYIDEGKLKKIDNEINIKLL